jgi:two-component system nitrate/nitrite sensor histidine kinase NarX
LREYLPRFEEQSDVQAVMLVAPDWPVRLPAHAETQAMRIVQEALSNVRKHAAARQVSIELGLSDGRPQIVVRDDGRGFDLGLCEECDGCDGCSEDCPGCRLGHFGLQIMRERANSVGASLRIRSAPGQGTQVALLLPLDGGEAVPSGWETAGARLGGDNEAST